mgnify:CR=1 FL=1
MIRAYRAFIDGDYATSRGNYQQLLSRDSTDADAWYGLGDVWFHDTTKSVQVGHRHHTIRPTGPSRRPSGSTPATTSPTSTSSSC